MSFSTKWVYSVVDLNCPVNWAHPLNRGLVSWWSTPSGLPRSNTWRDLVGLSQRKGYNSTLTNGPTWTLGKDGKRSALKFDGTDDYASTVSNSVFGSSGSKTWGAWITTTATSAGFVIGYNGSNYAGALFVNNFVSVGGTTNKASFSVYTNAWRVVTSNTTINDGKWYHLVGVYDAAAATVSIYINGVLDNTAAATGTQGTQSGVLMFGGLPNGAPQTPFAGSYFSGQTDDIRIYNRVLSATEVVNLMQDSALGSPDTLNWLV